MLSKSLLLIYRAKKKEISTFVNFRKFRQLQHKAVKLLYVFLLESSDILEVWHKRNNFSLGFKEGQS